MAFSLDNLTNDLSAAKIGGSIAVLFSAFIYRVYTENGVHMMLIVAGVILSILATIGALLIGLIVAMTIARQHKNQPLGQVRYSLSENGLELETDDRHEQFFWDQIANIGRNDRFIWLTTTDNGMRFVRRTSCESDALFYDIWNELKEATGTA